MRQLSYPADRTKNPDQINERTRDVLLVRADGMRLFILILFGILVFRLYSLQFLSRERFEDQARKNVEKKVITDPVRCRG